MLKVSESLILGVDISDGEDISVVQIVRCHGNVREVVNTLYGEDAEITYNHLINNQPRHIASLCSSLRMSKSKSKEVPK